ncbi:MAG: HNH endonuclease, partial [archaeon]|nr:HNH endonuclease [archaeon]
MEIVDEVKVKIQWMLLCLSQEKSKSVEHSILRGINSMPPSAVKTIRDIIYWQYAKLMAKSSGHEKDYGFIMSLFKKLQTGKIGWSGSIREYVRDLERDKVCIYCGKKENLSVDHLIPRSRGGPDIGDNAILACKSCNASKGDKGIFEWYGLDRRNEIPRIVEGRYLKLLYTLHEKNNTLDKGTGAIAELCEICRLGRLCKETKFTVYCLE